MFIQPGVPFLVEVTWVSWHARRKDDTSHIGWGQLPPRVGGSPGKPAWLQDSEPQRGSHEGFGSPGAHPRKYAVERAAWWGQVQVRPKQAPGCKGVSAG